MCWSFTACTFICSLLNTCFCEDDGDAIHSCNARPAHVHPKDRLRVLLSRGKWASCCPRCTACEKWAQFPFARSTCNRPLGCTCAAQALHECLVSPSSSQKQVFNSEKRNIQYRTSTCANSTLMAWICAWLSSLHIISMMNSSAYLKYSQHNCILKVRLILLYIKRTTIKTFA